MELENIVANTAYIQAGEYRCVGVYSMSVNYAHPYHIVYEVW